MVKIKAVVIILKILANFIVHRFLQATQPTFTCLKSTMERLEKGKKYVQS